MANPTQTMNLRLDLSCQVGLNVNAREYMKDLAITYDHATPQSAYDCWWLWNCRNVPDPMPPALRVLKITPQEAIGCGLSKEDADQIDRLANPGQSLPHPTPRDYLQQQRDRQELEEAVLGLGSFINQFSNLSLQRPQVLALAILENGNNSGVVSAARAARLLAEADDA